MTDRRQELTDRFRRQQLFAETYSPLYAAIFGLVAEWLTDGGDPVADWLLAAAGEREAIEVALLLLAALHRDVLAGEPSAASLARFFPTANGAWPATDGDTAALAEAVRGAVLARRDAMAAFIGQANVQTNETGRGTVWLLPVACLGWPAVHLVELGASAGLNLVADRRGYRLADAAEPSRTLLTLGDAPPQFTTLVSGAAEFPPTAPTPRVLSRTGGDMFPFHLRGSEDELTLASFIWGDQPARVNRLREGITALRAAERSAAPVSLRPLRLPDELTAFLDDIAPPDPAAPVVLYNTAVTMYLPDQGGSVSAIIANWAGRQRGPVLRFQWEPAREGQEPPVSEWFVWSADWWPNDGRQAHQQWHIAWVHPHGTAIQFTPEWPEFLRITMQS